MGEPASAELYMGDSVQDLDRQAEQVAQAEIETRDLRMLLELAIVMHSNATGHEKIGDMEMAYVYIKMSLLFQAKIEEAGNSGTLCDTFGCPDSLEDCTRASDLHSRLRETLDRRYSDRGARAAAAGRLRMETERIGVLVSLPLRGGAGLSDSASAPQLTLAGPPAETRVVEGTGAMAPRDVTSGRETSSTERRGREVERNGSGQQLIQPHANNQSAAAAQNRKTDLYLGNSLEDLDKCAENFLFRYVNGQSAIQLATLARHTFGNALGQEDGGDPELAYVYSAISVGFNRAAAQQRDGRSLEDEYKCLMGFTERLSDAHDRLREAVRRRYALRGGLGNAAQIILPGVQPKFTTVEHRSPLFISSQPRDSSGGSVSPQSPQGSSDDVTVTGNADANHEPADANYEPVVGSAQHASIFKGLRKRLEHNSHMQPSSENLLAGSVRPASEAAAMNLDVLHAVMELMKIIMMLEPFWKLHSKNIQADAKTDDGTSTAVLGEPAAGMNGKQDLRSLATPGTFVPVNQDAQARADGTSTSRGSDNSSDGELSKVASSAKAAGLVGITNAGATCYMGSVLQCLSNTPQVTHIVNEVQRLKTSKRTAVAKRFAELLTSLQSGLAPSVDKLKVELGKREGGEKYQGFRQQDAQELLAFLLNQLSEDLKIEPLAGDARLPQQTENDHNPPGDEAATQANETDREDHDPTTVDKIFRGDAKSTVTCSACHQSSHKRDNFYCLTLEIPTHKPRCSLQDCLRSYIGHETIKDYTCQLCNKREGAVKKIDICLLPPALIISFKRFRAHKDYDAESKTVGISKLDTWIDFPLESLDVNTLGVSANSYSLVAVINHSGKMNRGHYTAFCKNSMQNSWFKFDDDKVQRLEDSEVVTQDAYIVVYSASNEHPATAKKSLI